MAYTKGKVNENSSGGCSKSKENLFAICPLRFLISRTIGNFYICPVIYIYIYIYIYNLFKFMLNKIISLKLL